MRLTSLVSTNYNLAFGAVVAFNPWAGNRLYDKSCEYSLFYFLISLKNGSVVLASLTLTRAICHIHFATNGCDGS